jgi:hypothetical protein
MGFTGLNWPQYAWIAAAVALVVLMAIQGSDTVAYNLRVCLELQRNSPDATRIARLTNRYFMAVASQGVMQVVTMSSWPALRWDFNFLRRRATEVAVV